MNRNTASPSGIVAAAAVTAILFLLFIVDVMRVRGDSMEPVLREGETIIVNTAAFGLSLPFVSRYLVRWGSPDPGDVVVFPHPSQPRLLVKRVIAEAGEPLSVTNDSLTVGGQRLPLTPVQMRMFRNFESIPPGTLFVAGDNRSHSEDSREYGFVPIEKIIGKVIFFSLSASRKGSFS